MKLFRRNRPKEAETELQKARVLIFEKVGELYGDIAMLAEGSFEYTESEELLIRFVTNIAMGEYLARDSS